MHRLHLLIVCLAVAQPVSAELRLLAAELPPHTYQVPSASVAELPGPGQGVLHELVTEAAHRIGHSGRIEYLPWYRAQDIGQNEEGVGIIALTRSHEREDEYRWLLHLLDDDLVLVGAEGVDVGDLHKVRDRSIGCSSAAVRRCWSKAWDSRALSRSVKNG